MTMIPFPFFPIYSLPPTTSCCIPLVRLFLPTQRDQDVHVPEVISPVLPALGRRTPTPQLPTKSPLVPLDLYSYLAAVLVSFSSPPNAVSPMSTHIYTQRECLSPGLPGPPSRPRLAFTVHPQNFHRKSPSQEWESRMSKGKNKEEKTQRCPRPGKIGIIKSSQRNKQLGRSETFPRSDRILLYHRVCHQKKSSRWFKRPSC